MKLHIVAGLIAGLIAVTFAGITASAQTPAPAPLPAFEVAAVRPAALPTPETFRSGQFRIGSTVDKGRADFEFVSLADLLPYAFGVKSFQVSGPEWMKASRWNIQATVPEGAPQGQVPAMMQQLLADRFQLTIHHEKREQPVYELVVAKGGPKLEAAEAVSGAPATDNAPNVGLPGLFGGIGAGPVGPPPGPPPPGGRAGDGRGGAVFAGANGTTRISPNGNCGMHLELASVTMASLSDTLAPFLDRPVLDETELKGPYKVVLDLPIEVLFGMFRNAIQGAGFGAPGQGGGFGGPGRGDDGGGRGGGGPFAGCGEALGAGGDPSSNAALFQAVQKLGLKLQQKKALFDTIIVDHLEKAPTEN